MKGVPLIPFPNTKLQISDLQATARALSIICIVQHFDVVLCCKEHHCICFRQYKACLTSVHHTVMLKLHKQMNSDVLSRPPNPVTQTERKYPHRLRPRTLFNQIEKERCKETHQSFGIWPDVGLKFGFPVFWLTTFFDCKFFTWAAPIMFAVNIETNGNPHHHPWSIGKRMLSSWLPVRSAKDQGGAKVTHTL